VHDGDLVEPQVLARLLELLDRIGQKEKRVSPSLIGVSGRNSPFSAASGFRWK
jgi:hypothetical protein